MNDVLQGTSTGAAAKLTVVVTTYERPDYLRESLATIAAQTSRGAFKVVVLDNASKSDYSGVIAQYADDLDLVYLRNETNIGAEGNIMRALTDFRDTEYLTVFHDDDLMHPRMIEWQLRLLDEKPEMLFVATQFAMFTDGEAPPRGLWENHETPRADVYPEAADFVRSVMAGSQPCFSSVMYRTRILDRVSFDFERYNMYVDRPYLVDIARLGPSALLLAPLVLYRLHCAQDSGSGAQSLSSLIELMKAYRDVLASAGNLTELELFRAQSNRFLIGGYGVLPPNGRPSPSEFVRRGRAEGVLWVPGFSLLQWARILRAGLRGWLARRA